MKLLLSTSVLCLFLTFSFSQTVQLTAFGTGFSTPVEIAHAGDSRLFIVERSGVIKVLNSDGTVNSTAFLDISSIVGSGGERGLLGLAFAPDYVTSGRFYVHYTDDSSTDTPNTVIARYTVSGNPDIANTSGTILLTYSQPFGNHNGGKIAFGADGYLYIASGDGGSGGDPGDRAQDNTTLLGKLLRIDVVGPNYSIPSTNPFSSSANSPNDPRPEIYAIGLRNPWKFSFDKDTDDLWIADVGQNAWEEINMVLDSGTPGDNYGWRCYEGSITFNSTGSCPPTGGFGATVAPVGEYAHGPDPCSASITGGYVYRGSMYPNFIGKYFFADYCNQTIGVLTDTGSVWSLAFQTPNFTNGWTTFGEDINGELYIAGGSTVYKIEDANLSIDDFGVKHFRLFPNPAIGEVSVDLSPQFNKVQTVSIFNIQGRKIKTFEHIKEQIITFQTESYSNGVYFVEVQLNDQSRIVKKMIVN